MKIVDKLLKDYIKNLSEFSRGDFIYDEFAINGFKAGYQAAIDQLRKLHEDLATYKAIQFLEKDVEEEE